MAHSQLIEVKRELAKFTKISLRNTVHTSKLMPYSNYQALEM